jgi:hypothetical protein
MDRLVSPDLDLILSKIINLLFILIWYAFCQTINRLKMMNFNSLFNRFWVKKKCVQYLNLYEVGNERNRMRIN